MRIDPAARSSRRMPAMAPPLPLLRVQRGRTRRPGSPPRWSQAAERRRDPVPRWPERLCLTHGRTAGGRSGLRLKQVGRKTARRNGASAGPHRRSSSLMTRANPVGRTGPVRRRWGGPSAGPVGARGSLPRSDRLGRGAAPVQERSVGPEGDGASLRRRPLSRRPGTRRWERNSTTSRLPARLRATHPCRPAQPRGLSGRSSTGSVGAM